MLYANVLPGSVDGRGGSRADTTRSSMKKERGDDRRHHHMAPWPEEYRQLLWNHRMQALVAMSDSS
jgi:hypothetical protein